jgi:hypothetical protein
MGWRRRAAAEGAGLPEQRAEVVDSGEAAIAQVLSGEVGEGVSMREALSLPGVWAAINFLSAAMAGLPIEVFEATADEGGDKKLKGGVVDVLGAAVNELCHRGQIRNAIRCDDHNMLTHAAAPRCAWSAISRHFCSASDRRARKLSSSIDR